jgi:hypothetical protein
VQQRRRCYTDAHSQLDRQEQRTRKVVRPEIRAGQLASETVAISRGLMLDEPKRSMPVTATDADQR